MLKKLRNFDLTAQNKLIIMGLVISTLLIITVAVVAIEKIQERLYDSYSNFGQLLTKTLAIQTYELTKDLPDEYQVNILKTHSNSILKSNKDISFITFKNKAGKIIYTSSDDITDRLEQTKINISSPMRDNAGKIVGSVEIGLSTDMAAAVAKTTKNSMLVVFTLVWIIFTVLVVINTFLIARELTLLHHGVKEISSGRFGTVLDYSQASGEIKELFSAFNDMSKRLRTYEEQNIDTLTLEKNKLEAVLMSIANGVVVCDNLDKISMVNNAAQKILGARAGELINTQVQNFCDTNGNLCFKEKIVLFKNTPLDVMEKKPLEFNIKIDTSTIKAIMSPMYSKVHDYMGYIIILIDITKEAEVDKLKNDFISNVSHELRTPVTVLRSYADTLYSYGENFSYEEQKDFIGTINQEVIRLNKMVNDILDFSKLQSDTEYEKTTQDIMHSIEKTVESLSVLAQEKNIVFSVIKEPNLPDILYNEDSIERVISNLVTNAIKYSPNNSRIKIRAELAKNPNYVEVTVEDSGVGIAQEHHQKIFDRFYRIENDTHTIKGTGLGLHLVKVTVEKHHGGEVFVHSKLNEGSAFGFRIPVDASKEPITIEEEPIIAAKAQTENAVMENQNTIASIKAEVQQEENAEEFVDIPFEAPRQTKTEDLGWEMSFEVRENNLN